MDEWIELKIRGQSVEIGFPVGSGGQSAHLYANRYYKGIFLKYQGKWEFRPQKEDHGFTVQEVDTMINQLEKNDW